MKTKKYRVYIEDSEKKEYIPDAPLLIIYVEAETKEEAKSRALERLKVEVDNVWR